MKRVLILMVLGFCLTTGQAKADHNDSFIGQQLINLNADLIDLKGSFNRNFQTADTRFRNLETRIQRLEQRRKRINLVDKKKEANQ